ncbi:D-aspartate ligase [Clostridia bacterium]|nr:D-aspartate ligase [Clostridia bacterium]
MKVVKNTFLPILLGTDLNSYGMARAFHEEYGIKSLALGEFWLTPTQYSAIVDVRILEGFGTQEGFLAGLNSIYEEYHSKFEKMLLVSCNDNYTRLVVKNKKKLEEHFIVPCVEEELFERLATKEAFYETCEEYGLDYPETYIITQKDTKVKFDVKFPLFVKASNSAKYSKCSFTGQKKAFFIDKRADFDRIVEMIYDSPYDDSLIVQKMIPGDDDSMRVLNCYVGKDSKVKLMCLGQILIEDKASQTVGNYLAIMNDYNPEICNKVKSFLEAIKYTGFANFDMKFDASDGKFKFFEINLRQGRSSFFATGSGFNLAKYLVKDRIFDENLGFEIAKAEHLWLELPKRLALRNVGQQHKKKVKHLIKNGKVCWMLSYEKDRNIFRSWQNAKFYLRRWINRGWKGGK